MKKLIPLILIVMLLVIGLCSCNSIQASIEDAISNLPNGI